jgi:hypothetical protein
MRGPIELAVKETQRAAQLKGIKTLSLLTTMVDRPYSDPVYEPLWARSKRPGAIGQDSATWRQ